MADAQPASHTSQILRCFVALSSPRAKEHPTLNSVSVFEVQPLGGGCGPNPFNFDRCRGRFVFTTSCAARATGRTRSGPRQIPISPCFWHSVRFGQRYESRVQRETTTGRGTIGEIEEQIDHLAPSTKAGDFEFRPLTEEEKKAFVSSLDVQGRQLLTELGGGATGSRDAKPVNTTTPTTAPYRISVNGRDCSSMAGICDV